MGLLEILMKRPRSAGNDGVDGAEDDEEDFGVGGRSSTQVSNLKQYPNLNGEAPGTPPLRFASRLTGHKRDVSQDTTGTTSPSPLHSASASLQSLPPLTPPEPLLKRVPKITAILTPEEYAPTAPLPIPFIRRVDTPHLFLATNLHLAKSDVALPGQPATSTNTVEATEATMHAQPKIDPTCNISPKTTITQQDCLLGVNCTVMEKCVIKRCVLGPNVTVHKGARLMGCVLLEGCVVEEDVKMDGCVLGRGSRVGKGSVLKECEIGHGYVVDDETEAKGERLVVLEGIEGGDGSGWGSDDQDEDYSESESESQSGSGEEGGDEGEDEESGEESSQVKAVSLQKPKFSPTSLAAPAPIPSPSLPPPLLKPEAKAPSTEPSAGQNIVSKMASLSTGTLVEEIPNAEAEGRKSGEKVV